MASNIPEDDNDIIKCSICFDIFNNPKYLPCLHTFCEACLDSYITSCLKNTVDDGGSQKGFPCPICRVSTDISDRKFPSNHLLVTLIDQHKLKTTKKTCDPCTEIGKSTDATSWCTECNEALCKNCDEIHRAMKVSRHHHITNIDEFKSQQKYITSISQCDEHRDEKLKFYCVDHDTPVCSTCVTVNHRKCENVKTLENAAEGSRENSHIQEITERFKEMIHVFKTMIADKENNLKDIDATKIDTQATISQFREEINKYLDSMEARLNEDFNAMHKDFTNEIKDEIAELENNKKVTENCHIISRACLESASEIHIFLETKRLQKHQKEQEEYLKSKLETLKRVNYQLELEKDLSNIQTKVKSMGKMVRNVSAVDMKQILGIVKYLSFKQLKNCKAKELKTIQVTGSRLIHSGVFLPDGRILLSDFFNKRLLIYDDKGHQHGVIPLPDNPRDIAVIDSKEAVVTLNGGQRLQFVDMVNFTVGQQIKMDGLYHSVGYDGRHLFVGCNNKSIAVIEKNGNIIRRIQTTGNCFGCIAVHENKILYPPHNNELQCYDKNGQHLFTYSSNDLGRSWGVSCDNDGNTYVSGYGSNNIHQLDPNGNLIKIILSEERGISNPCGINFEQNTGRFLVTFNQTDKLKLFKLEL